MLIWKVCHHANITAAAHLSEAVGILAGSGFKINNTSHRFYTDAGTILAFKRKTFIGSY